MTGEPQAWHRDRYDYDDQAPQVHIPSQRRSEAECGTAIVAEPHVEVPSYHLSRCQVCIRVASGDTSHRMVIRTVFG